MSSPIGDGNGTRAGNRVLFLLAFLSTAFVLVLVAVGVNALTGAIEGEPRQPTSSTSTRSTP